MLHLREMRIQGIPGFVHGAQRQRGYQMITQLSAALLSSPVGGPSLAQEHCAFWEPFGSTRSCSCDSQKHFKCCLKNTEMTSVISREMLIHQCSLLSQNHDSRDGVPAVLRAAARLPGAEAVVGCVHGLPLGGHADDRSVRMYFAGKCPTL